MTRWLLTVFILLVFSQAAFAVSDPRPDVLGVYFDETGDRNCKDDPLPAVPFSVWFVYTNPSVPFILGFEAGYHTTATFFRLGLYPPCMIIYPVEPDLDNLFVACGSPIPTAVATPLFRIDYMYLGVEPWDSVFYLEKAGGSAMPGNNPFVVLPDGSLMEVQAGAVSYTTLFCGVATEKREWGSVKSLYR